MQRRLVKQKIGIVARWRGDILVADVARLLPDLRGQRAHRRVYALRGTAVAGVEQVAERGDGVLHRGRQFLPLSARCVQDAGVSVSSVQPMSSDPVPKV